MAEMLLQPIALANDGKLSRSPFGGLVKSSSTCRLTACKRCGDLPAQPAATPGPRCRSEARASAGPPSAVRHSAGGRRPDVVTACRADAARNGDQPEGFADPPGRPLLRTIHLTPAGLEPAE